MLLLERWTEPLAESNCYLLGEAGRAVVIDPNDPRRWGGRRSGSS